MKYLLLIVAFIACILCGFAGLTMGVNLNPATTTRYVPNWGSIGDWVSGLGALLAVGVALWQSYIQRKEDVEDLVINQAQGNDRWRVSVVSKGKRPARVQWIGFYSREIDTILPIKSFVFHGDDASLPQTLSYAEDIQFVTRPDLFLDLAINAVVTFDDSLKDLEIHVKTTLGVFRAPVLEETKDAFRAAIKKQHDDYVNAVVV
ncbi:hypothetical protein KVG88_00470 [Pseudomonas sp. SWRI74]|uniref:Uncharacterized protein n=1 Tax=Pseudomonas azerbaijanoccidentalis TaxID=2842347 RepID=A0ABS6QHX6_9PSED|nr:hypothetical protein [Pseudomonas azerbaijanoccidentalis]MBV4518522.1 hypothetical protein [Pseudomonas azerbaijanoccidentalis]